MAAIASCSAFESKCDLKVGYRPFDDVRQSAFLGREGRKNQAVSISPDVDCCLWRQLRTCFSANADSSSDASQNNFTDKGSADHQLLEEVAITAQKRPKRLKEIPVAAQVVSSQALTAANVVDLSDLNNLVPPVQLNGTINGRVPTGIRGISSVSSEGAVGISSGVAVMIDGVPVPSDSFDANNVMGFQSIEVLLGPQSTLGGRTAASGLINLTTRGPTDAPYAFVNATVTSDREYRLEGFLSGPLVYRVEGSLDAYRRTTPDPITNLTLNQITTQDVYGARAKLKFAITDDLDLTLMVGAKDRTHAAMIGLKRGIIEF